MKNVLNACLEYWRKAVTTYKSWSDRKKKWSDFAVCYFILFILFLLYWPFSNAVAKEWHLFWPLLDLLLKFAFGVALFAIPVIIFNSEVEPKNQSQTQSKPFSIITSTGVKEYPAMPVWPKNNLTFHGSANWDNPIEISKREDGGRNDKLKSGCFYVGGGNASNYIHSVTHAVTIAGSGQGKGVCVILPNLLSVPHCSWFVLDPKGENALITARFQKSCNQKVIILDPWDEQKRLGRKHDISPSGFNPLAFVLRNPKEMPESCGVIADMLVPDRPHVSEPFWDNRARTLIKTYLLHIITACPRDQQHLGRLYELLRLPLEARTILWQEMDDNMECDEAVRSGIREFSGFSKDSKTLDSIIATAQDSTAFLQSIPLRESLKQNDFDPYELTNGKTTVYVCLPERFLNTHNRWMRLVVGVCLKACNYRPDKRVNFLLDEFAILGKMQEIERAYAFARGQNISIWVFVQSLTQLKEIYGENGANSFLSNARIRQFFGVYDLATQKYLSEYLGENTIKFIVTNETTSSGGSSGITETESEQDGYNYQSAYGPSGGSNGSGSSYGKGKSKSNASGSNWSKSSSKSEQYIARRLLTAEEIGKSSQIITLIDGYKFCLPRIPYWDDLAKAHKENRAKYYPEDKSDWIKFIEDTWGQIPQEIAVNFSKISDPDEKEIKEGQRFQN